MTDKRFGHFPPPMGNMYPRLPNAPSAPFEHSTHQMQSLSYANMGPTFPHIPHTRPPFVSVCPQPPVFHHNLRMQPPFGHHTAPPCGPSVGFVNRPQYKPNVSQNRPHFGGGAHHNRPNCGSHHNNHHSGSRLNTGYYWVPYDSSRGVPPTAVRGGSDSDGTEIYVGRAYHEGDWCPAKVIPSKHVAYIPYGGQEHALDNYEVLCEQKFHWVGCSGGNIPHQAVEGGRTCDGETLYIGRVYHAGAQTVGKVHPSHGCLYIPYDGQEMRFDCYEILVLL